MQIMYYFMLTYSEIRRNLHLQMQIDKVRKVNTWIYILDVLFPLVWKKHKLSKLTSIWKGNIIFPVVSCLKWRCMDVWKKVNTGIFSSYTIQVSTIVCAATSCRRRASSDRSHSCCHLHEKEKRKREKDRGGGSILCLVWHLSKPAL